MLHEKGVQAAVWPYLATAVVLLASGMADASYAF